MRIRTAVAIGASAVALGGGVALAPLTFAATAPGSGCPDVEIIGARATTERPGLGVQIGPLAQQITKAVPLSVRTTAVDYPASFNYQPSVAAGVKALAADMQKTAAACANTRFVLAGYSQGANVVGDALAGRGRGAPAVSADLAKRVDAVILFGDPTFTAGESFNITDGKKSGVFTRGKGKLDTFAARTESFCNANDEFCQGGTSLAAHLDYAKNLTKATDFAKKQLG
jgi:Cutinase